MKTFAVHTLGCKVNSYESEAVKLLMLGHGYVYDQNQPDIVIVNTCSVTGMSAKKSRQAIRRYLQQKEDAIVAVMGCYSQLEPTALFEATGAHVIVGTNNRQALPQLIETYEKTGQPQVAIASDNRTWNYENLEVTAYSDRTRAYVKIQDGCDNFCSYCIIPYARGRLRSRPKEAIFEEIGKLVAHGYKELVLTGIHTAGYGRDFKNYSFDDLIEDILTRFPELYRLRISSIEASEITPRFLKLLAREPRLARHLHIPLQSGADNVLKAMNRHYASQAFAAKIHEIYTLVPDIAITTDIIVGFPGETDEDFRQTYELAETLAYAKIHVFPFSKRAGTRAATLKEEVEAKTIKGRVDKLLELSQRLEDRYAAKFIGQTVEVILEQYDVTKEAYEGHTSNYLKVFVQGGADLKGAVISCVYRGSDIVVPIEKTIFR